MDTLLAPLIGLDKFLIYFAASLAMLALFIAVYLRATPYHEIELIRAGNVAAAASLSGAVLGFALPLASAVIYSASLPDMLMWGVIALLGQLAGYFLVKFLIPHLTTDIPEGKLAPGIFLGAVSLSIGILNAACMAY
jgi:putative membrane protein